jgi:hypothetical protein
MSTLLLDQAAPAPDADLAVTVLVDAPAADAYAAAVHTDFAQMPQHDPVLKALFGGAIARLGGAETVWRRTSAREYAAFAEPGWVKLLLSVNVRPYGERSSLLTYETRAVATDDTARRSFLRYWKLFQPGIRVVLSRSLRAIKREAESDIRRRSAP